MAMSKLEVILNALSNAEKPLIFAGGQNWTTEACVQLTKFAGR